MISFKFGVSGSKTLLTCAWVKGSLAEKIRASIIFFISCEKEEKAIDVIGCTDPLASNYNQFANISNNSNCNYESYSTTIPLTSSYQNQIFFNVKNNIFIAENLK